MEWNEVVDTTLSVAAADKSAVQDSDLIMVGVYAPAKDDDEDDDEEEKEEEEPEVSLSGMAKEIDDSLGGALSELMKDNAKEFKHGAQAGSTTPTARVISADGKVSRKRSAEILIQFSICCHVLFSVLTVQTSTSIKSLSLVQKICCVGNGNDPQRG